jgi:hypothetical protein
MWHEPERPAAARLAVLAPAAHALAAGAAVGLALAKGPVLVASWGADRVRAAPAQPRARRLASKLGARGHDAAATGRLVVVTLAAPDEAARVSAVADVPMVLVVAGPRDDHVDRVLRDHDAAIVVGDGLLADLATASVQALGVPTASLALPDAAVARALAASGLALVAPWRAALEEAVR